MKKTKERPKYQRRSREWIFRQLIAAIGSQIFEFYDLPDGLTSYEINIALATGRCIITDIGKNTGGINHGWICAPAYCVTPMRLDGTASEYIIDIPTDGGYIFSEKDKIIMLRNSFAMVNTLKNVDWFAAEFANIDMTLKSLSKGARRSPAIKTMSCNVNAYTQAAKNAYNEDAEIQVIADNSDMLTGTAAKSDSVLDLTDPTIADKIHFISEYREELERRLCTLHGVPFSTTAKSKQNLSDEIHDMDMISQFLNDSIMTALEYDLAIGNAKCGTDIKVRYGRLMREQIEIIEQTQENKIKDGENNEGTKDDNSTDNGNDGGGNNGPD